jgi:hypothetical protein
MLIIDKIGKCICKHIPYNLDIYMFLEDVSSLQYIISNKRYFIYLWVLRLLAKGESWYNSHKFIAAPSGPPDESKQAYYVQKLEEYRNKKYDSMYTVGELAIRIYNSIRNIRTDKVLNDKDDEAKLIKEAESFSQLFKWREFYCKYLSKWIRHSPKIFPCVNDFIINIKKELSEFEPCIQLGHPFDIIIDRDIKYAILQVRNWDINQVVMISLEPFICDSTEVISINCYKKYGYIMNKVFYIMDTIVNFLPFHQNVCISTHNILKINFIHQDNAQTTIFFSFLKLLATGEKLFSEYGFIATDIDGYPDETIEIRNKKMITDYQQENSGVKEKANIFYERIQTILLTYDNKLKPEESGYIYDAQQFIREHVLNFRKISPMLIGKWMDK